MVSNTRRLPTSLATPFIGVRISWLIAARKVDFARSAASAYARAASAKSRSRSAALRAD
jgi:hypothetical protein